MANYKDLKYIFPASSIASGTLATARLGSGTANNSTFLRGDQSYQALSEFNDDKLVNDISTLALHQATNNNSAKYNLTNSNVDVYQDSSAVANLTNVVRDTTGEYMASVSSSGTAVPTNAKLYLKANSSANNSTSTTDHSGTSTPVVMTGGCKFITQGDVPIGATAGNPSTTAFWVDGNNESINSAFSDFSSKGNFGTNDFSLSAYVRFNNANSYNTIMSFGGTGSSTNYEGWKVYLDGNNLKFIYYKNGSDDFLMSKSASLSTDTWYHLAVSHNGSTDVMTMYKNGASIGTQSTSGKNFNEYDNSIDLKIGKSGDNTLDMAGRLDHILITNGSTPYTSNFTPRTTYYGLTETTNATGSYESTAQTANASVNKISAVVTYTNASGTNTLNTDIVLQVSADNGSNWSNATLTAAGTFSTGVLQAVTNDVSVTAGTQLKYKIAFANQASGSKVARINGVSLSY